MAVLQSAHTGSATLRRAASAIARVGARCTCAFSSSCRFAHPLSTQSSSGVDAYNKLFDGLAFRQAPNLPSSSSTSTSAPTEHVPRPYGPAYGEVLAPRVTPQPTFPRKSSLDINRYADGGWLSERNDVQRSAAERAPIDWAKLLDLTQQIQHSDQPGSTSLQAESAAVAQPLSESYQENLPELLPHDTIFSHDHDLIHQREATALSDSLDLRAEVKQLQTASEAIKWMQERIFSRSDPDSLINKIETAQEVPSQKLLSVYPHLLTDLINLLREVSPNTALMPLRQAAQHSAKSYLYGCTKSVYHAALRVLWEKFGDVEGCLQLLEEMERGGVNFGSATVDMMTRVSDTVSADILNGQEKVIADSREASASTSTNGNPQSFARRAPLGEREQDALAEQYMFFSNAQRRAAGKIDKLTIASRARTIAAINKENMLEDMIRQSNKLSREFGAEEATQSHVNQIIDSYGRMRKTVNWMAPYKSAFDLQRSAVRSRTRTRGHFATCTSSQVSVETDKRHTRREQPDILSMAIDEASAVRPRTVAQRQQSS